MLCYIKDMKTFETISKFDSTEYSLAAGENGQVTIYQKNAIELTTKYVGMWLIINKELFYISGATPNNDSIDLIIQEPIFAFSRQVEYDQSSTYGALVKNILDDNFGVNCPDIEYKLSYLSVTNTDTTPCFIEPDDYGYIIPYEIFDDALYNGVAIRFTFSNTELFVTVSTANYSVEPIVFNDGSTTIESESYDANYVAKVTVIHDLPAPEEESDPEQEPEQEESYYEVIDYYLSADNHISTTPPVNRAKGVWKYYRATQDEIPLSVAIGAFSHNNDNHKIEFRCLKRLELYQPIKMRLRNDIFTTIITSRILSNEDNRYYYKCGNLATTLTEKIDEETKENSDEIKYIKSKISKINNQLANDIIPIKLGGTGADNAEDAVANLGIATNLEYLENRNSGVSVSAGGTATVCTLTLTVGVWLCFFVARSSVSASTPMNVTLSSSAGVAQTVRTTQQNGGGALSSSIFEVDSGTASLTGSVYFGTAANANGYLFAIKISEL